MEKMTYKQLQEHLQLLPTLDVCATFLINNAHALRKLFYSGISERPSGSTCLAGEREFEGEQALISFFNSPCGDQLRSGSVPPPAVTALFIYFISLCEQAGFHHRIKQISEILPQGALRIRASVIFQYKFIPLASINYIDRFEEIITSLQSVWDDAPPLLKAQCEDFVVEYFCAAATREQGVGEQNRVALLSLFTDHSNQVRLSILTSKHVINILNLPVDRLKQEREDTNARIAESFYDEAALLLPVPQQLRHTANCTETGRSHGGHCPPKFHQARVALAEKYPLEFANTNYFVKQPLTAAMYTEFNDTTKCMRYFRQYMPLHMPQIEEAVRLTLEQKFFSRRRLHIIDIGGGPGTLYTVLASLLHRGLCQDYSFDVTLVEPSIAFHDFLQVIALHVHHPNLNVRGIYSCTSDQLPSIMSKKDADWYFIANAITPIVRGAGNVSEAVNRLFNVINTTRRKHSKCILTLAENTNSIDFNDVCSTVKTKGLDCVSKENYCHGSWLSDCRQFYVTGPLRPTQPRLKYAYIPFPEGFGAQ
jgi:hypothetical protein